MKIKSLLLIGLIGLFFNKNIYSSENPIPFNVITYNIQTGSNYRADTPEKIAKLLEEWNVDVFGTQELHYQQVLEFEKFLPEYSWFGVGRDNGKEHGEMGAIFYKTKKLELLEESTFWLSETPESPGSISWGASDTRIVTWGKFLIKENNRLMFVFNTHYDHVSSEARENSSLLLRKKMKEIAGLNPIIITGDFNCSYGSTPYIKLIQENLEDLNVNNSESISQTDPFGPSGSYNAFSNNNPTTRIDFIFANQYFRTKSCGVINEKPDGEFISDHFPVFAELLVEFPTPPKMPTLKAIAGDGYINLIWDKAAEDSTYESFIVEANDFQGYKLYRSRDPEMKDAELLPGSWNIPLLRKPLLVCDKVDDIYGYTDYGISEGFGYYLGENSGLQHFYQDTDVENGQEYYYLLTAYDNGIENVGSGFAPAENTFEIKLDGEDNVVSHSKNIAIITPIKLDDNTIVAEAESIISESVIGNVDVAAQVFNPDKIVNEISYTLTFDVDTLEHLESNSKYRHPRDLLYVNTGFKVVNNYNDSLIYYENKSIFTADNVVYDNVDLFYHLNSEKQIETDEFDGIQLKINYSSRIGRFSQERSGWIEGNSNIKIIPSIAESQYFPWKYEVIFTDENNGYTGLTNKLKGFKDTNGDAVGPAAIMLKQDFNFYVINKSFKQDDESYEKLDLVVYDVDMNGEYDHKIDQVLVGHCLTVANQILWKGTVFSIDFSDIEDNTNMPKPGDKYVVDFNRPFMDSDEVVIEVDPEGGIVDVKEAELIPNRFSLDQNYPNPFNPTTSIKFQIAKSGNYTLKIYNLLGQLVKTVYSGNLIPGTYVKDFNGKELSSGIYIYSLKGEGEMISKKMMMIK